MAIMVSSARSDERGKFSGGKAGDQKQTSKTNDTKGEVSMQAMYTHSKGWYILRPKSIDHANRNAELGIKAANNANIGYSQADRLGVVRNGIDTKIKTNADCSSLVRQVVKEATGKDPGNFTTSNEAKILMATGLFEKSTYVNQKKTPVYNGDILVTKTKGHTVMVVSGNPRKISGNPYPVPTRVIKKTDPMTVGDDVAWVQYHLVRLGCMSATTKTGKSNIDKKFWETSEAGVIAAQKKYGVPVNGIVDSRMVDILRWN